MADDLVLVKIVFQDGKEAEYTIAKAELDRLAAEFQQSLQGHTRGGIYDVRRDSHERKLSLRFSDVRYIG